MMKMMISLILSLSLAQALTKKSKKTFTYLFQKSGTYLLYKRCYRSTVHIGF